MPFAKFLYEQARNNWSAGWPSWSKATKTEKQLWEAYARTVAAHFGR